MVSNVKSCWKYGAVISMSEALNKFKLPGILINVFGEFDEYENPNIKKIDLLRIKKYIPNGNFSKIILLFNNFCFNSNFILLKEKKTRYYNCKPCCYIPNILKIFTNIKVINSIQGFPRFNIFRKIIWKIFYSNSDHFITMSNLTKEMLIKNFNFQKELLKLIIQ